MEIHFVQGGYSMKMRKKCNIICVEVKKCKQ